MRVLLAGGGTAGHTSPLIATADALRRLDPTVEVHCLGTPRGLENTVVPRAGYPLHLIPPVPLPRKPSGELLRVPLRLRDAVRRTLEVFDTVQPDVVVGYGGYVSMPAYLAARRRRLPLVVHEQNALPGLANKVGARVADRVAVSFHGTPLPKAEYVGLPIRRMISTLDREAARAGARRFFGLDADRPTLLVTGGSQGAPAAQPVRLLRPPRPSARPGCRCCTSWARRARPAPSRPACPTRCSTSSTAWTSPTPPPTWSSAAPARPASPRRPAVGLPAVFVPLPIGNGEQTLNARTVVDAGGALLVGDEALTPEWVRATVPGLLHDRDRLARDGRRRGGARAPRRRRGAGPDHRRGRPVRVPVPDELLPADRLGRVHFVGIGGAGLSAIARIMAGPGRAGHRQRRPGHPVPAVAARGRRHLPPRLRRRPRRRPGRDTVVVTTAAREDNPEVLEARRRGLRLLPRSAGLAAVMAGRRVLAVAGTHGKTTTTGLLTTALLAAGADPTYAVGGVLTATGRNADAGTDDLFVAEADESDGAFLVYRPHAAIVTNVEADHLDNWGTEEAYHAAFDEFAGTIDRDGFLVVVGDDEGAAALAAYRPDRGPRGRHGRGGRRPATCAWSTSPSRAPRPRAGAARRASPGRARPRHPGTPLRARRGDGARGRPPARLSTSTTCWPGWPASPARAGGWSSRARRRACASTTPTPTTRSRSPATCEAARAVAGRRPHRRRLPAPPRLPHPDLRRADGRRARRRRRGRRPRRLRRPRGRRPVGHRSAWSPTPCRSTTGTSSSSPTSTRCPRPSWPARAPATWC